MAWLNNSTVFEYNVYKIQHINLLMLLPLAPFVLTDKHILSFQHLQLFLALTSDNMCYLHLKTTNQTSMAVLF